MANFASEIVSTSAAIMPSRFASELATITASILPTKFASEVVSDIVSVRRIPLLRLDQIRSPLIAVLRHADMNTVADQEIVLGPDRYIIRRVIVGNASISLSTAVGGIYTDLLKFGSIIVPANQSYAALTSPEKFIDTSLGASVGTDTFTNQVVYFSLSTPQGALARADIYIYGDAVEL